MDEPSPDTISSGTQRHQACDSCRDRKTRCDRGTPCSSCRTAGLVCRITRTKPEKRNRIIISAKYDEALQNVDTRLQEVLDAVHELKVSGKDTEKRQTALQHASDFPTGFVSANPTSSISTKQYRGESSFESQFERATNALGSFGGIHHRTPLGSTGSFQNILNWASTSEDNGWRQSGLSDQTPLLEQYPGLAKHSLPPSDTILRLLRFTQTEKQRFFVDVDLFDEQHFTELCRNVFFAINPYSIWTWSIVNIGLYYLFMGLSPHRYSELGLDAGQVDDITDTLANNAQAAVKSFQICDDLSLDGCQALSLAATFCMKSGQITKAWALMSTAARMCVDLGFHRPTPGTAELDRFQSRKVFWYVFVMEKGVALTLGRPPNLRIADVTVDTLDYPNEILGIPGKIAIAFFELATIEEEMASQLFSSSSQQVAAGTRQSVATGFRQRLQDVQKRMQMDDCFAGLPYQEASVLIEYLLHAAATVACVASTSHIILTPNPESHFCASCVSSARQALEVLRQATGTGPRAASKGWALFLNITLCLSPFTPYLVLAGHTLAERSVADFQLLSRVNEILVPVSETSPLARDTLKMCKTLHQQLQSLLSSNLDTASHEPGTRTGAQLMGASVQEQCLTVSSGTTAAGSPFSDWQVDQHSSSSNRLRYDEKKEILK